MPRLSKIGAAALAAFGWTGLQTVNASYLVVAGGGGGGGKWGGGGGGGGAGGYRTGTTTLNPTLSYAVTVGAGGAGVSSTATTNGVSGSDSVFSTITSSGGGGGGTSTSAAGSSGGSGGGGATGYFNGGDPNGVGGSGNTPSTSPSQGNNGGTANSAGTPASASRYLGGGGGGAGAVGGNASTTVAGNGGAGTASSISGSSVTYAGGGGGGAGRESGASSVTAGTGGSGGGGNGGSEAGGSSGTANLGGGGGGAGYQTTASSGNGGSGVVIISYTGTQQFGGGIVTSSGGNTIHTFTTSGTLSPLSQLSASYLIVAGGGAGGGQVGGGGGAGGYLSGSSLTIDTNSIYAVTVGAGGTGTAFSGNNGSNSSFSMVSTAAVGGGGGGSSNTGTAAGNGGSGGGSGGFGTTIGTGTSGQGFGGGSSAGAPNYPGGGGGGASAVGGNASTTVAGVGGAGTASSISGTSVTYATGGNGGRYNVGSANGTAATANTGNGGGGSSTGSAGAGEVGGAGGSGVVIISYAGSTPQMAGGTVTVAGGNVIHTFTSSGYLSPIVNVNNSLRFRSSASAYLNRTPTVAGNRKTWTWSAWVKLGTIAASNGTLFNAGTTSGVNTRFYLRYTGSQFQTGYGSQNLDTTVAVYRDPSAWYHVVLAIDTTQATAANRLKIYVNGVQQAVSTSVNYSQNDDTAVNNTVSHQIASDQIIPGGYFDGYMAEINFVDGQALTPNSFGSFNGLGVWQPVRYGGSYGTNGFYLPFTATQSFTGIFSGSSQWISVPNLAAYNVGTNNYTVEGWFYITSLASTQGLWGSNNGSGSTPKFLGLVNTSGAVLLEFTNSGGATFLTSSSGVVTTNKWHHIAWVRNSGTSTIYVNGVNVGSTATSVNLSGLTQPWNIGYIGEAGPSSLTGNASNFRLVTGTAVYTSNFIPQTTPLTAISGTQILTLQNATLIDNSTNAQTVTNTGGVTVGATYPFAILNNVIKDFGPAGNNWTANNIGQTTGSTLDTMTDVPTNTSATVANYCVWNPLAGDISKITVSDGNLNAQSTAQSCSIGGTMQLLSGKWYWETTITKSNIQQVGIIADTLLRTNASVVAGDSAGGYIYLGNGQFYNNGSTSLTGSSYTTNDVISVAFDADSRKLWFAKNGTWQNSGVPASGTGQVFTVSSSYTYIPVASAGGGTDQVGQRVNFGQQPFVYTPPSGFVALNTFNLPTPTIGATPATTANKYFDATTYSGNGGTQSITSLGFQPDLVWVKRRNAVASHNLVDAVRGASKILYSDATTAEITDTNDINAFNSNGWTMGLNTDVNASGGTYVGWTWRGANGTVTNTAGSIISSVSANTTAGFSIVTYTGNATNGATVGHGLGVSPSMIIGKIRSTTGDWYVWQTAMGDNFVKLNTTAAQLASTANGVYNTASFSSTVFALGSGSTMNASGGTFVAYCFSAVAGYSAFGSYTGNGSSDGPFVFTGFRPKYVLIKASSTTGDWWLEDTTRNPYNAADLVLFPNTSGAESGSGVYYWDFLSNGFKLRSTSTGYNGSGTTYIYAAFAESPFKYANAR